MFYPSWRIIEKKGDCGTRVLEVTCLGAKADHGVAVINAGIKLTREKKD